MWRNENFFLWKVFFGFEERKEGSDWERDWRHFKACTNWRVEMCYWESAFRDGFVTRTCSQGQGARVWGYPEMPFFRRIWYLWKETRATSSSLQRAPNGARMLAGVAETTAGSSCQLRWGCCQKSRSGHDVSEYELGASGLPRAYVSPQQKKSWCGATFPRAGYFSCHFYFKRREHCYGDKWNWYRGKLVIVVFQITK